MVTGIEEGDWKADHIAAELRELPIQEDHRETTIFKSVGLAVEDLFAADLVLKSAGGA